LGWLNAGLRVEGRFYGHRINPKPDGTHATTDQAQVACHPSAWITGCLQDGLEEMAVDDLSGLE